MNFIRNLVAPKTAKPAEVHRKEFGIVIVDMQQDVKAGFTHKESVEAGICKMSRLLSYAREFGIPRVFVTMESPKKPWEDDRIIRPLAEAAGKDAKILEKSMFSAFSNPELSEFLRQNRIRTIVLGGYNMDVCVKATAKDAIGQYNVMTSDDILFGSVFAPLMTAHATISFYRKNTEFYSSIDSVISILAS